MKLFIRDKTSYNRKRFRYSKGGSTFIKKNGKWIPMKAGKTKI